MCWPFLDGLGTSDSQTLTVLPINYYLTTGQRHATHWMCENIHFSDYYIFRQEIVREILNNTVTVTC